MRNISKIDKIKKIPDIDKKHIAADKFINQYLSNNFVQEVNEIIYFLIDLFLESHGIKNDYARYYYDKTKFFTVKFLNDVYVNDMNTDNVEVLLSVAGTVYDLSCNYSDKVDLVIKALTSPDITKLQKKRALEMVLNGEPETTKLLGNLQKEYMTMYHNL